VDTGQGQREQGSRARACLANKHCKKTYKATSSSSSLLHHLDHSHILWARQHLAQSDATAPSDDEHEQMEDAITGSSVSVATSSKASSSSVPRAAAAAARPRSVADLFTAQSHQSVLQTAAIAFAKNGIAHRVVQTPSFSALLSAVGWNGAPPTRRSLRDALLTHSSNLRARLLSRLRNSQTAVSVAIDGWTNVRHDKVTNVLVLQGGQAFYWCSITNAADILSARLW
jgi:hypothetical protein